MDYSNIEPNDTTQSKSSEIIKTHRINAITTLKDEGYRSYSLLYNPDNYHVISLSYKDENPCFYCEKLFSENQTQTNYKAKFDSSTEAHDHLLEKKHIYLECGYSNDFSGVME
ncbi:MAG: hypothetical protein COA79_21160 [Planctomycetota bacterium]|nr:MAG: hypothetical protein COA79_21160 [Planctomycetota bacterium]